MIKTLISMVAGVTFEGRQDILANLNGDEAVTLIPEPDNKYDLHAIKVMVSSSIGQLQVGYIPKGIASAIPDAASAMATIVGIVGGEMADSSLGLRIRITFEIPDPGFTESLIDDQATLDTLEQFKFCDWDDDPDDYPDDYEDNDDMEPMWLYGDWGDQ